MGQLSLLNKCSRACELQLLKPTSPRTQAPQQEKPPQRETHTRQLEEPPLAVTRENPRAAMKTQHSQKEIQIEFKNPQSIWVFPNKSKSLRAGRVSEARAEMRKLIGRSAPALRTQAPLVPDSRLLRGLEAPSLWPPYLYTWSTSVTV